MRIFVFEYITGGGLADRPMLSELVAEGDMMLHALVEDLLEIPEVQIELTRDARLPLPDLPVPVRWIDDRADLARVLRRSIAEADAVWPIAPETEGALEDLSNAVLAAGRKLLNSHPTGVHVASSKLKTASALSACALPAVPTWAAEDAPDGARGCWVLKPDRGVGGLGTRLVRGSDALQAAMAELGNPLGWVAQPYLRGQAASLSLLIDQGEAHLLACNRLRVAVRDDGFALLGCEVNGLLDADREECAELAQGVAAAIPGLWGFVGVDFIMTRHGPVILEVNPRLTSCYPGLSMSLGVNVAEVLLDLAEGRHWEPGLVDQRCVEIDLERCYVV